MHPNNSILYLSSYLPRLSETFVYREIFELRHIGWTIHTASLHPPEQSFKEENLQQLTDQTTVVYSGWVALFVDALLESAFHPVRTARTWITAISDALGAADLTPRGRLVIPGQLLAALALARRIRPKKIGHIHAHMAHSPTTVAMYTALQLNLRFSFTGHAADLFRDRALLHQKLERAAFVACISHWHRSFYQKEYRRPAEAYPIIRCGVDPKYFTPSENRESGSTLHLLSVGRLVQKKGFDTLLHALHLLTEEHIPFECRLIGNGEEYDPLTTLCAELGLSESVSFLGALPNTEIKEHMNWANLFILPCRIAESGDQDGIPVVLMEAMACEICVISGRLPAINELVRNYETGCTVPSDDPKALAAQIKKMSEHPEYRTQLASKGHLWIVEEFSLCHNAQRLNSIFKDIVGGVPHE